MNDRDFRIYWGIKTLKQTTNSGDSLAHYLQGCLDAGIKQERIDKIIDKVKEDIK